ncbi:transposase family protein [Bradyrhizobium sp. UFLA05-153]
MQRALRPSALVPPGFVVESAVCEGTATVITVRPTGDTGLCPGCRASSGRIHSRYQRRLTDLPLAGRPVRLMVVARLTRSWFARSDRSRRGRGPAFQRTRFV